MVPEWSKRIIVKSQGKATKAEERSVAIRGLSRQVDHRSGSALSEYLVLKYGANYSIYPGGQL